jgi:hypothetical protein
MTLPRWSAPRLLLALALCVPFTACQKDSSTPQAPNKDTPTKEGTSPASPKNNAVPPKNGDASKSTGSADKSKPE